MKYCNGCLYSYDFFIGAHAAVKDYTLITRDKGHFSTYFPSVNLIMPHRA